MVPGIKLFFISKLSASFPLVRIAKCTWTVLKNSRLLFMYLSRNQMVIMCYLISTNFSRNIKHPHLSLKDQHVSIHPPKTCLILPYLETLGEGRVCRFAVHFTHRKWIIKSIKDSDNVFYGYCFLTVNSRNM